MAAGKGAVAPKNDRQSKAVMAMLERKDHKT
jgi:hypothetical protein